jgi:hypothetical protein
MSMTRDQFWGYAEFIVSCVGTYLVIAMFAIILIFGGGRACH